MSRLKRIPFSFDALSQWFESDKSFRCSHKLLPDGCKVSHVTVDPSHHCFWVFLENPAFDDLEEGELVPEFGGGSIQFERLDLEDIRGKGWEKGVRDFAIWRDGEQLVGALETPLAEVLEEGPKGGF